MFELHGWLVIEFGEKSWYEPSEERLEEDGFNKRAYDFLMDAFARAHMPKHQFIVNTEHDFVMASFSAGQPRERGWLAAIESLFLEVGAFGRSSYGQAHLRGENPNEPAFGVFHTLTLANGKVRHGRDEALSALLPAMSPGP